MFEGHAKLHHEAVHSHTHPHGVWPWWLWTVSWSTWTASCLDGWDPKVAIWSLICVRTEACPLFVGFSKCCNNFSGLRLAVQLHCLPNHARTRLCILLYFSYVYIYTHIPYQCIDHITAKMSFIQFEVLGLGSTWWRQTVGASPTGKYGTSAKTNLFRITWTNQKHFQPTKA